MTILIAVIAAGAAWTPAAAAATQAHDHVVQSRAVVRVQQTQVQRREQERVRQQEERVQQQRERARAQAAERAERARRAQSQYREEQTEKISRTLKIGGNGELDLSNLSGDITITRGGAGSVQIEALKVARGRTAEEARAMLPLVNVSFVERGSRAEVRVTYPRYEPGDRSRRNANVSVNFTITAPENARISAKSLSGSIKVADIKGDLNVVSTSGNVTVTNGARVMSAKSTSGSVEIVGLQSEIAFQAGSLSGDVVVRQSRAPRMELGTISGNLTLDDVQCERLDAQTLSGDLELTTALSKNGRYDLSSHSGTIRINPSGDTGFELDANTFSGSIQSDVTLKDQRQGVVDAGRRGPGGRPRSIRGVYGDGSALLDITTFSGNVVIRRK
jgi:DUF4097 and DUF4098 domain-containing protein YvlB